MLCSTCSTLSYTSNAKPCAKCKESTSINIAILCDKCSIRDLLCAICLKRTNNLIIKDKKISKCRCNSG